MNPEELLEWITLKAFAKFQPGVALWQPRGQRYHFTKTQTLKGGPEHLTITASIAAKVSTGIAFAAVI